LIDQILTVIFSKEVIAGNDRIEDFRFIYKIYKEVVMKNRLVIVLFACFFLLSVSSSFAQVKQGDKFIGAAIGLWAGIAFSVNGEFILKDLPDLGTIGAGVEIGYAGEDLGWYSYSYIPIFGFASFHYRLESMPKLDPYARLGVGFVVVSSSYTGLPGYDFGANNSYISIDGQVGVRYAVTPNIWLRVGAGTPWILCLGVDIGF
jgi:hypothetical protein